LRGGGQGGRRRRAGCAWNVANGRRCRGQRSTDAWYPPPVSVLVAGLIHLAYLYIAQRPASHPAANESIAKRPSWRSQCGLEFRRPPILEVRVRESGSLLVSLKLESGPETIFPFAPRSLPRYSWDSGLPRPKYHLPIDDDITGLHTTAVHLPQISPMCAGGRTLVTLLSAAPTALRPSRPRLYLPLPPRQRARGVARSLLPLAHYRRRAERSMYMGARMYVCAVKG
jgi:hypothetical protein